MVHNYALVAISISVVVWLAASPNLTFAAKIQLRLDGDSEVRPHSDSPFSPHNAPSEDPDALQPSDDPGILVPFEDLEADEIPVIETIELTLDVAQRALNALSEVRDKYNERGIDDYETLEDFVASTDAGKELEADVRRFGFESITDWNRSISSVGFAYSAVQDDEESLIREQIVEIKRDPDIAEDARTKMIASLEAMIASTNNKAIVRQLLDDGYYAAKLRLLDPTE